MDDPVEGFFARYSPEVQAISRALRDMVLGAIPEAIERLFASQDHVSYLFTQASRDALVYICPLKDYVRLGFYYGGNLPDPEGVLVGEGKRLRHVKVYSLGAASNPALELLVKEAWVEATGRLKRARIPNP